MEMLKTLRKIPSDIEAAARINPRISVKGRIDSIVVCGMGGSGISGDIVRDYLKYESKIPVIVNKSYRLPSFVNKNTLVFVITYSGRTAETLSMLKDAKKKKAKVVAMALPYLFFPIITVLEKLKLLKSQKASIKETVKLLRRFDNSKAQNIAAIIGKRTPVIYSHDAFSSVVLRWKTELNENAKIIAHNCTFPELNHNEINATNYSDFAVIIIRDREDPGTKKQIEAAEKLIKSYTEIKTSGKSLLARMFYAIYFGDWVSYYLAKNLGKDPSIVPAIDFIKKKIK
jgi:glucose/mannose-6-phosphate isomerase